MSEQPAPSTTAEPVQSRPACSPPSELSAAEREHAHVLLDQELDAKEQAASALHSSDLDEKRA